MLIEHWRRRERALAHPISERLANFGFCQSQGAFNVLDLFLSFVLLFSLRKQVAHPTEEPEGVVAYSEKLSKVGTLRIAHLCHPYG